MSKITIILCILIVILISLRYFDPFDKGLQIGKNVKNLC
jgi:hypothetical protein